MGFIIVFVGKSVMQNHNISVITYQQSNDLSVSYNPVMESCRFWASWLPRAGAPDCHVRSGVVA